MRQRQHLGIMLLLVVVDLVAIEVSQRLEFCPTRRKPPAEGKIPPGVGRDGNGMGRGEEEPGSLKWTRAW